MKLTAMLLAGLVSGLPLAALADTQVTYPAPEAATDTRFNDLIEILKTSLEKTTAKYGAYTLAPSKSTMNEARQIKGLQDGADINILWTSTSEEKESTFLPIRIPLRKGLLGFRVALIAKDKQANIDKIKTLDDLKKASIGWGDVQLYESNGLKVTTANYDNLFLMAEAGRIDLFPRGIGEAFNEFDTHTAKMPNLAVEKNLLIQYPWPYYFFFNKKDKALAERVEAGIRIMMKDGSFDALFKKYNGEAIARANLKTRRVIQIKNPFLPKATPVDDKSLWFDPAKDL